MLQATPYGLAPPLGSARLTVVALIAVLLRTGLQIAEEAIMQAMLLSLCLQLVITYPFNSLLHHKVRPVMPALSMLHLSEILMMTAGFQNETVLSSGLTASESRSWQQCIDYLQGCLSGASKKPCYRYSSVKLQNAQSIFAPSKQGLL